MYYNWSQQPIKYYEVYDICQQVYMPHRFLLCYKGIYMINAESASKLSLVNN